MAELLSQDVKIAHMQYMLHSIYCKFEELCSPVKVPKFNSSLGFSTSRTKRTLFCLIFSVETQFCSAPEFYSSRLDLEIRKVCVQHDKPICWSC